MPVLPNPRFTPMYDQPLHLPPGTGIARFADCGIVLDIARDRYWRVTPAVAFALDWLGGRTFGPILPAMLDRLVALGLAGQGERPAPAQTMSVPCPHTSPLDQRENGGQEFGLAIHVLRHALAAILAVRTVRLAQLIDLVVRRRRTTNPGGQRRDLITLARAYARYRPLLPITPRCLPDALAFLALAHRHGHYPALVFGVTAHPFAAHCWVQAGPVVLTDQFDHVRAFTPILTI